MDRYGKNASTSDLQRWAVDRKVRDFLAEPPPDWLRRILKWSHIDLTKLGADWERICELIQRRHCIVHNGGRVDEQYLDRVPENLRRGAYLGQQLVSNAEYLEAIYVDLITFAAGVSLRWVIHFFDTSPALYIDLLQRIVQLEEMGRWANASALCEIALSGPAPTTEDDHDTIEMLRVNWWFCQQEMGLERPEARKDIREWTPTDVPLQLARAILLRDMEEVAEIVRRIESGPSPFLLKRELERAPLIQRAMQNSPEIARLLARSRSPSPKRSKRKSRR